MERPNKSSLTITAILLVLASAIPFIFAQTNKEPQQQQQPVKIAVTLRNSTANPNRYELFDNVCNRSLGSVTLPSKASTSIQLCSSGVVSDGYGSLRVRIGELTIWTTFDRLRTGQAVKHND